MKYKKAIKKVSLTKWDKSQRLETVRSWFCDNHPWEQTIFTDEKRFSLDGPDDWRSYVAKDSNINRKKRQCGGGGVLVWMMVMPNGLLAFQFLEGKVDSKKYIKLLKTCALPILYLNYRSDFFFQQDNAPVHRSKETTNFLKSANVKILKWPPRSPDMNIIEDMWRVISDIIYDGPPYETREQLRLAIKKAIDDLNKTKRHFALHLYQHFRSRLLVVLDKRGDLYNK